MLTANQEVDHYIDQELRSLRMAASTHIFKGAFVGVSRGYARGLVAGDKFVGIAYEEIDNANGSDGEVAVRIYTLGDFGLSLPGATVTDICRSVWATSDDTLTFLPKGNSFVGAVVDIVTEGEILLRLRCFEGGLG